MNKLLGIIGCGAVTQNNYVKVIGKYRGIEAKYVFDIDPLLSASVARILDAEVVTREKLIDGSDIIVIATPPLTHYQLVYDALKPEKKVICEKPFVGTLKECLELIDIADKRNADLYVAHFRRCYPSVELARSVIESGILGDVLSIEAYEGGRFSWKTKSGYVFKDPYGGVLFDTGSHTLDMALYIAKLDELDLTPEVLSIKKDKKEPAHEIEAYLRLITTFKDISLRIRLSRKIILANKIRINCSNGFLEVPTVMASYLRIGGAGSSTIIYTNKVYPELMDCFAVQFKAMFYQEKDSIFNAKRFINLTKLLEIISKD